MTTSDIIGVLNVVAQFAVAVVAIWAVIASLRSNKKQIEASDRQLREQIKASEIQIYKQVEESRRLAIEERQHQSRPIIVPRGKISHNQITIYSLETDSYDESLYTSENTINWSWSHPIKINVHNMGNGPAFNIHCVLYGSEDTCQSQFVSWDNGPLEEKSSTDLTLTHSLQLRLFHNNTVDQEHPLYDKSLDTQSNPWIYRIACLTITYHDLFGNKHVSIFHYTLQHQWTHLVTKEIPGKPSLDLKEMNSRAKQAPKLPASPVKTL